MAGEDLGFRQVGCQHRGAGDELAFQRIDRARFDQRRAAFGDHDRIDDQRHRWGALGNHCGDDFDHRGIVQHPGFQRVGTDVVEHDFDLLADEIGRDRQYAEHPLGILCGQCGDGRHGESAQHRHGLDVGLNTGAAARIRAGDDQHPSVHRYDPDIIRRPAPAI